MAKLRCPIYRFLNHPVTRPQKNRLASALPGGFRIIDFFTQPLIRLFWIYWINFQQMYAWSFPDLARLTVNDKKIKIRPFIFAQLPVLHGLLLVRIILEGCIKKNPIFKRRKKALESNFRLTNTFFKTLFFKLVCLTLFLEISNMIASHSVQVSTELSWDDVAYYFSFRISY